MNSMPFVSILLLLLAVPGAATETRARRFSDLAALEAEFERAQEEWKVAYAAAREADVPRAERPADPAVAFWPRFEAALQAGEGRATLWLVEHARDADFGRKEREVRQAALVAQAFKAHAREPWLEELCFLLAKSKRDFDPAALEGWVNGWLDEELEPELRAAGSWLAAEVIGRDIKSQLARSDEITAALQAALRAAPESAAGREAASGLFRALERELRAELAAWRAGAQGEAPARPDLGAWRSRFRALADSGVELAEVWFSGTHWIEEPDADYERLLVLITEAERRWNERVEEAEAEAEAEGEQGEAPVLTGRVVSLYGLHPERLSWLAFEHLADSEPRASAWLVEHANLDPDPSPASRDRLFGRLDALVRDHGDAEWTVGLAESLLRGSLNALGAARVAELCARWADATTNEEVQIRLRYQLALARLEQNEAEGLALLGELGERWPDHPYAQLASGRIASRTQLAIGQVAPDIVASDLDGLEFKLSDYRGKVVVLDFWGDW